MTASPDDRLRLIEWPVVTSRLSLRRARAEDAEALWRYWSRPEVVQWLGWAPADRADWEATYPGKRDGLLVIEREGSVVGDLTFRIEDGWGQREVADAAAGTQAELGWVLDPDFTGRGYATEAVRAAIDLAFGPLGLRRVVANAFADNEASWRLMERLGMRRESLTRAESLHRERGWLDGVGYALLASEWPDAAG